jgi:hypothetical protein
VRQLAESSGDSSLLDEIPHANPDMRTSVMHLVHAFNALPRDAPLHTLPGQITLALDVGHRLKALLEQYLMQSTSDPSTLVPDIKKSPKPGVFTFYTFLGMCALLKFNAPSTGEARTWLSTQTVPRPPTYARNPPPPQTFTPMHL